MHLHKFAIVHQGANNLVHVVSHVGVVGYDFVQQVLFAVDGVGALNAWCTLHVVLRNEREQFADNAGKLLLSLGSKVAHTTLGRVNGGTAKVLLGHVLASHRLNHLGAGQEHVADAFEHNHKVGQCR